MEEKYRVLGYSRENLAECLKRYSKCSEGMISAKPHLGYFNGYFAALAARTIIVEPDYIDHDYLEDYSAYYVRCFEDYKRLTTRLHFFSKEFTSDDITNILAGKAHQGDVDNLNRAYLGFIVIKPLPQTIIGRTCLKTYPHAPGGRNFPVLRQYSANLFGISLKVDSLAYQEQDKVVAACATSALWSCFQQTGMLFQHSIPSPVEITKSATKYIPLFENINLRGIPNGGLTPAQMAISIKEVALEPHIIAIRGAYSLSGTLYAYLKCGIPSILLMEIKDEAEKTTFGWHAVAVTGFSLELGKTASAIQNEFLLRATKISKIYVHDDQIGPFARMEYAPGKLYLTSSWENKRVIPENLMIPLYHKIRIPFQIIHDAIFEYDALFEQARLHYLNGQLARPEWDIYLTTISDFKKDILDSKLDLLGNKAESILTKNLPKYLWRATASINDKINLDLLFDATGIEQQALLVQVVCYHPIMPAITSAMVASGIGFTDHPQVIEIFKRIQNKSEQ
jgi:hypothetical protein